MVFSLRGASVQGSGSYRYRWAILFAAFVAGMAGPIALFAMPPLFPALTAFLGVSLSGIGFTAMTSFGIGISVMAIPFAILSPRLGWKTAGIACLGTISMGALITTVFPTFWGIFLGRFIAGLGFGMAFTWPVGALSVWFRKDEMGLATGIWATTLPVSGLLIFVLAPVLITSYGWISVLWFSFLFAIASLALWAVLAQQPADDGTRISGYFADERSACLSHDCIESVFLDREMWLVAIAWFALNYYLLGITSLAPAYFTTVLGFSLFTASALAILPVSMIIWVAPVAGRLSDRLHTRKTFILISMAAGLLLCPVIFFPRPGFLSWALFFVVLGIVWGMIPATVFASPREIVGPEHAGPASGILNLMVGLAALSAPLITESLVPVIGWQGALASTALPSVAGVVAMVKARRLK
ncbi:MFS transporter [Methanoregula sp.]|uniref:MFS transporter n=1 Tax=Methanoregula sp. TaxID=2052170 RepID=UPI003BB07DE5